jgi:hypothetical protein
MCTAASLKLYYQHSQQMLDVCIRCRTHACHGPTREKSLTSSDGLLGNLSCSDNSFLRILHTLCIHKMGSLAALLTLEQG